jgi:hypothetical protein
MRTAWGGGISLVDLLHAGALVSADLLLQRRQVLSLGAWGGVGVCARMT